MIGRVWQGSCNCYAFKKGESCSIKVEEVILENERNRSHALQQLLLLCTLLAMHIGSQINTVASIGVVVDKIE